MTISEEELAMMMKRNPSLRIKDLSNPNPTDKALANLRKALEAEKPKKPPKYRNYKVYIYADGYADVTGKVSERHGKIEAVYDSQREYQRHNELRLLERAGEIHGLVWQYPMLIQEAFQYNGETVKAIEYVADFFYYRAGDAQPTVEDVKGLDANTGRHVQTKDFKLKWKLLKYRYPDHRFVIY